MARIASVFCAILVMASLSACATSRSVVDIKSAPLAANAAPAAGPAVRLVKVTDARLFDAEPPNPSTPSLSSSDINNAALKARAVGRKRNTYGMALGDVMLPDGQTVAGLLTTATETGLTRAGFRVLHKGEPGYDGAAPVELWINKYWSWVTLGALEGTFHNQAEIELTSDLSAFHNRTVVNGAAEEGGWKGSWETVATKGLNDLIDHIAAAFAK